MIVASCHCGAIQLEVPTPPENVSVMLSYNVVSDNETRP